MRFKPASTASQPCKRLMRCLCLTSELILDCDDLLLQVRESILRGCDVGLRLQTRSSSEVGVAARERSLLVDAVACQSDGVEIVVQRQLSGDVEIASNQSLAWMRGRQTDRQKRTQVE